ncbi:MAG TPA: hypothetical protein VM681_03665 [Candidatus Thermoplasmatota archaeon]|nr:hypothetical protein [Candidatus Thermoplasmatota archaeon]
MTRRIRAVGLALVALLLVASTPASLAQSSYVGLHVSMEKPRFDLGESVVLYVRNDGNSDEAPLSNVQIRIEYASFDVSAAHTVHTVTMPAIQPQTVHRHVWDQRLDDGSQARAGRYTAYVYYEGESRGVTDFWINPAAGLRVATDKAVYARGEVMTIFVHNPGLETYQGYVNLLVSRFEDMGIYEGSGIRWWGGVNYAGGFEAVIPPGESRSTTYDPSYITMTDPYRPTVLVVAAAFGGKFGITQAAMQTSARPAPPPPSTEPPRPPPSASLSLTVYPSTAAVGEPFLFNVTNVGDGRVEGTPSWTVFGFRADGTMHAVFSPAVAAVVQTLPPGGSFSLRWDQRDNEGRQVAPGTYGVQFEMGGHAVRQTFSIRGVSAEGAIAIVFDGSSDGSSIVANLGTSVRFAVAWKSEAVSDAGLQVGVTTLGGFRTEPRPGMTAMHVAGDQRTRDAGECASDGERMDVNANAARDSGAADASPSLFFPHSGCWAEWEVRTPEVTAVTLAVGKGHDRAAGERDCAAWTLHVDGREIGTTSEICPQDGWTWTTLRVPLGRTLTAGLHTFRVTYTVTAGQPWTNGYLQSFALEQPGPTYSDTSASGSAVFRFPVEARAGRAPSGEMRFSWDLTDAGGVALSPGSYVILAKYGSLEARAHVFVAPALINISPPPMPILDVPPIPVCPIYGQAAMDAGSPGPRATLVLPGCGFEVSGDSVRGQFVSFRYGDDGALLDYAVGGTTLFARLAVPCAADARAEIRLVGGALMVRNGCVAWTVRDTPGGGILGAAVGDSGSARTFTVALGAGASARVEGAHARVSAGGASGALALSSDACGSFSGTGSRIAATLAAEGYRGDAEREGAPHCTLVFKGMLHDAPVTPEGIRAAVAVSAAVAEGRVGAEVVIGPVEGRPALRSVQSYGGVEVELLAASSTALKLQVGKEAHEGKAIVVNLCDQPIRLDGRARVLFDDQPITLADSIEDVLNPRDDGDKPAEFLLVLTAGCPQLLVSVSGFSIHTIELLSSEGLQALLVQGMLLGGGLVVMASVLLFRRPEE